MPVNIFICYAPKDEVQLNKLKTYLIPLQRQGLIDVWHDRDIHPGTERKREIEEHLNSAQIVLLLVSPDFIASNYCYSIMERALERRDRREATVIPVILRQVRWQGEPLGELQALPKNGKPVKSWRDQDKAFDDVVTGIQDVVIDLTSPRTDDFSVNVQIRIYRRGSEYRAEINADGSNWQHFDIKLKQDDVKAINSDLRQAIEDVSGHFEKMDGTCDDTLALLAHKGKDAFNEIFQDGVPREIIRRALKASATIQFSSEEYFIPWELLYDDPQDAKVDPRYFWGMRHIVSRALILEARSGDLVSPIMQASPPHVGLIAYTNAEQEILQELHRNRQIYLTQLEPLNSSNPSQRTKGLKALHRFLHKDMQIAHLACHAHVNMEKTSESYLRISDEFPITIEDFGIGEFQIEHNPLVILNACLTEMISPLHTCNWAIEFFKCGARGILATEFHVPDWFAAAFIKELYTNFLSGNSIGEALIATRRLFWEEKRNPLGLAYALYSSPSIRITRSGRSKPLKV